MLPITFSVVMAEEKRDLEAKKSGEGTEIVMRYRERPADEKRFYTKVRKGMGVAKYSTLITTIPADVCKQLGIAPGDTVMWETRPGQKVTMLTPLDPLAVTNAELINKMIEKIPLESMTEEQRKAFLMTKKLFQEVANLPPEAKPKPKKADRITQKELDKAKKHLEENKN